MVIVSRRDGLPSRGAKHRRCMRPVGVIRSLISTMAVPLLPATIVAAVLLGAFESERHLGTPRLGSVERSAGAPWFEERCQCTLP